MEEIREAMETTVTPETPAEWWEGTSYEDAKAIIRSNMDNMARNSVAIGYYLRSIRDKQQYLEGGYQSFDAFVQVEYSMSYSAASRLIGLCERFSRGGNSPVLADSYQGYSKSLLVEMLPMSDAQLEQVRPGMTVAEVREIKRENREEAMPEPDPEPPAEEPEVIFQLEGEEEDVSRQEVVERLEAVMPAPMFEEDEPVATSQLPACVMGHAESGVCGAAAYCGQPARCCLQCDVDCNGRCGWIPAAEPKSDPKVATSQNQEPDPRRNLAMESQARVCLSNLNVEIGAKAWPAALASARHLVHYLGLVTGEKVLEVATSQEQDIWSGLLHDMPLFSRQSVRDYIADAEAELKEYMDCDGLPPTTVLREQMFVAGLRLLLQAVEKREEAEHEEF